MPLGQAVVMNRINDQLSKYFLCTVFLSLALMLGATLWAQGWLNFFDVAGYSSVFLLIYLLARQINIAKIQYRTEHWKAVRLQIPPLNYCLTAASCLLFGATLMACCFSTSLVWKYGGWNCSYILANFHQQALAERVYSVTNAWQDSSFVGASGACEKRRPKQTVAQFEQENFALDSVIANVYGAQSRRMARRYFLHGLHLFDCSETSPLGMDYLKRAFEIYQLHKDPNSSIEVLQFLAYPQGASHKYAELRATIKSARVLYSQSGCSESARRDLELIVFYAEEFGVDCTSEHILLQLVPARPTARTGLLDSALAFWCLWSIALVAALILATLRSVLLFCSNRKWLSASRKSTSVPDYLVQMEKLMILELALGNTAKADEYSRQSLAMATAWKI